MPSLDLAEKAVGAQALRQICIGLLSWLKARTRAPKMVAMKTSEVGSSKASLINLLEMPSVFSTIFTLQEDVVRLRDDWSSTDASEAIAAATRLYNPPRFVTKRPV